MDSKEEKPWWWRWLYNKEVDLGKFTYLCPIVIILIIIVITFVILIKSDRLIEQNTPRKGRRTTRGTQTEEEEKEDDNRDIDDGLVDGESGQREPVEGGYVPRYMVVPIKVFSDAIILKFVGVNSVSEKGNIYYSFENLASLVVRHPRFLNILQPDRGQDNLSYITETSDFFSVNQKRETGDFVSFRDPASPNTVYAMMRFKTRGIMSTVSQNYFFWFFAGETKLQLVPICAKDITSAMDQRHLNFSQFFKATVGDSSPKYSAVINPKAGQYGIEKNNSPLQSLTEDEWRGGHPYLLLDRVRGLMGVQRPYCPVFKSPSDSVVSGDVPVAFSIEEKPYHFFILREGEPETIQSCKVRVESEGGLPINKMYTSATYYLCSFVDFKLKKQLKGGGVKEKFLRHNYWRLAFSVCGKIYNSHHSSASASPTPGKKFELPIVTVLPSRISQLQAMCLHVTYSFSEKKKLLPDASVLILNKRKIGRMVSPVVGETSVLKKCLNFVPVNYSIEKTTPLYGFTYNDDEKEDRTTEEKIKKKQSLLVTPFSETCVSSSHFEKSFQFLLHCNYSIYAGNCEKLLEVIDSDQRKEMKLTDRGVYFTCSTSTVKAFRHDSGESALYCKIDSSPMSGQVFRVYPLTPLNARVSSARDPMKIQLDTGLFSWDRLETQCNKILCFKVNKSEEGDFILTAKTDIPVVRVDNLNTVDIHVPIDDKCTVGTIFLFTIEPLIQFFSYPQQEGLWISKLLLKKVGSAFVWLSEEKGLVAMSKY